MRRTVLVLICALGLIAPAASLAAGGPVPVIQGGDGVTAGASSTWAYIAVGHRRDTLLERVHRDSRTIEARRLIRGSFGVPQAAYDGSTTGLSADGRTLVLADVPRVYPPTRTRLVVIDPRSLRSIAAVTLRGFFAVDAVSPSGRWLYLLYYRSPNTDLLKYEVRAYDLVHRRLLAAPVVDPREPDEKMVGIATTRTMSPDGRWAYTLYQRPSEAPFIHALDTERRTAFCVDLPLPAGEDLSSARLVLGPPRTLRIEQGGAPIAVIDTRTFAATHPAPARPRAARPQAAPRRAQIGRAGTFPWWILTLVPVAAVVALGRRRVRDRAARRIEPGP